MHKTTKIKLKLTKHAKLRLLQRFGLDSIGKIYQKDVEILQSDTLDGAKIAFYLKKFKMVLLRNNRSHKVITVMTREMWENKDVKKD